MLVRNVGLILLPGAGAASQHDLRECEESLCCLGSGDLHLIMLMRASFTLLKISDYENSTNLNKYCICGCHSDVAGLVTDITTAVVSVKSMIHSLMQQTISNANNKFGFNEGITPGHYLEAEIQIHYCITEDAEAISVQHTCM